MHNFFNIEGPFFTFLNRLGDLILLNILWIVCCIPIITIGASTTALYYTTMKLANGDEGYLVRNFFKSFKQNFLQSTVIWLIMLAFGLFISYDIYMLFRVDFNLGSMAITLLLSLSFLLAVLYLFILVFIFPLQAKFENKIKYTFKNALILSIGHLPVTILLLVSLALAVFVFYKFSFMFPVFLFIGCSAIAFGYSFVFNKIFNKYIHKDDLPKDDSEKSPDAWTIPEEYDE